jgi:SAM-dependent methyltransferase
MHCLENFCPEWRNGVVHESSPVFRGASNKLRAACAGYVPSQYFPNVTAGSYLNAMRCENLECLTFSNDSVGVHVSQDVLEHVYNPALAFKEIARTLRPGGAHVFTTPLINKNKPSERCIAIEPDGRIRHLREPEYHGNPISESGSLVTMRWGYDICEFIHRHSGLFTEMIYIDSLELGIRAEFIEVLITRKLR